MIGKRDFYYLKRALENSSRFVRRMAVRKVHKLITTSPETLVDRERRHQIFALLLVAAQDKDSEWVRQEAAHTLAHYLDQHQGSFIVYVHLFIVKNLHVHLWEQIAHVTNSTVIRRYINAVTRLLSGLDESNVQESLGQMVQAQIAAENLLYGKDLRLIYGELHHLFTLETLVDISHYQCELHENHFLAKNQFAHNVFPIFNELDTITRLLKMYFRREGLQDQLTSLLEAIDAVDHMHETLDQQYSAFLLGAHMNKLPDYQVFLLLFKKWKGLMQTQLNELRGKAELKLSLQTRDVPKEEQVGILLSIKNEGRSSANDVKITLLQSADFHVLKDKSFETEVIPPGEETIAEFILKPCREFSQTQVGGCL